VPIVHRCAHPDCSTLTMGEFCIDHETASAADRARISDDLQNAVARAQAAANGEGTTTLAPGGLAA
jgi:hypothetical protein